MKHCRKSLRQLSVIWKDYWLDGEPVPTPQAGKVASVDRAIDELVYQLYGLTEDEIKIVEG